MVEKQHEHKHDIVDIFELIDFAYVVCKLRCECGDERWDIGTPCD